MKELFDELVKGARYVAACSCGVVGYLIGLPGLILNYVSDALITAAEWCVRGYDDGLIQTTDDPIE